ncbi:MAG: AAA family ATPase [Planctomycetes bacterium]|nr:AAA family ATPase [Planctomycetota bacterium]
MTEQLTDYVNAAFAGLWVQSLEPDEAEREIAQLARDKNWKFAAWDVSGGMRFPNAPHALATNVGSGDPLAMLRAVPTLAEKDGTAVLVLHNFHRFLNNPEIIQTTFAQLVAGKSQRTFLVVLAPVVQIPIELEKLFVILEHPLPDREQLNRIVQELTSDSPSDLPKGTELGKVLNASAGLTRYEAEGAFALSLARHGSIQPQAIWDLKTQTLKKSGLLTLHRGSEGFDKLGGLQALKVFCMRALMHRTSRIVKPKGVLLLGVPGVGKSAFAKALGNEAGRPTLVLDIGALYGSLVGATEGNIRQALRIIDAMAPCVLFLDEVEKALAGLGSSGDSGVSSRLFGTFLSWLSDHESDVFVVCTSNDISKLPPEFSRAERFDAVFFLDLPTRTEKDAIWKLYRGQFDIAPSEPMPEDTDWTGAEIRSCCRLSSLLDIPLSQATRNVVPVAVMATEQVERLRTWASGRCLSAASSGIYARNEGPKSGRRVQRGTSNN